MPIEVSIAKVYVALPCQVVEELESNRLGLPPRDETQFGSELGPLEQAKLPTAQRSEDSVEIRTSLFWAGVPILMVKVDQLPSLPLLSQC